MAIHSGKTVARGRSKRERVNVMVDRRKLKQVAAAVGAPTSSTAIDVALDRGFKPV